MNYTARQAYHQSSQITNNFDAVFTHITFMCMETIRRFSEFHCDKCVFEIPTYIMGFAIYDWRVVKYRLKKHLHSLEYKVKTSDNDEHVLVIWWKHISKSMHTYSK